jgi:hypothetical protein
VDIAVDVHIGPVVGFVVCAVIKRLVSNAFWGQWFSGGDFQFLRVKISFWGKGMFLQAINSLSFTLPRHLLLPLSLKFCHDGWI